MISYAQNQEDVVLCRLLGQIDKGCYVDVGAGHPILENVTYALYRAGWTGINIEPMPREAEMLRTERPEDVTLQIAASDRPGTTVLFEAPLENRGATTSDVDVVARYRAEGQAFEPFDVETRTLAAVVSEHVSGEVHILKVDVEGMELEVLSGADLVAVRPWVVVVEATAPNSQDETWAAWEPLLISAGYVFTLFDGLNRFYVSDDHPELVPLLSTPANVFDRWRSYAHVLADERADRAEAELETAETYVASLKDQEAVAQEYAASLEKSRDEALEYAANLEQAHQELTAKIARLSERDD